RPAGTSRPGGVRGGDARGVVPAVGAPASGGGGPDGTVVEAGRAGAVGGGRERSGRSVDHLLTGGRLAVAQWWRPAPEEAGQASAPARASVNASQRSHH